MLQVEIPSPYPGSGSHALDVALDVFVLDGDHPWVQGGQVVEPVGVCGDLRTLHGQPAPGSGVHYEDSIPLPS